MCRPDEHADAHQTYSSATGQREHRGDGDIILPTPFSPPCFGAVTSSLSKSANRFWPLAAMAAVVADGSGLRVERTGSFPEGGLVAPGLDGPVNVGAGRVVCSTAATESAGVGDTDGTLGQT
jgi:hypothetical protein